MIIFITSRFGVGLSPDSVAYISVARHISDGTGIVNFDGYLFVQQPPLYPLLLAAIVKLLNMDPLISAGYVNALLFGMIIYIAGLFLLRLLKSLSLTIIGIVFILVSYPIIQNFLIALSEPLFILFVLLYLYHFDNYRIERKFSSLLLFSTAVSFACLTRYVGVVIILAGSLSIYLWRGKTFKEMFRHLIIFLLIAITPTGLWILRNFLLSGTLIGQRSASSYTLAENLFFFSNTVLKWYFPIVIDYQQLFVLFLFISIGILAVYFLKRKRQIGQLRLTRIGPVLIFIVFYSSIIIISSTTTAYDQIANRLLSPVFVPLIFIIFVLLDIILKWISNYSHNRRISAFFLIGIIACIIYPVINTTYNIEYYFEQSGWEYDSKAWKDNSIISYLNNHRKFDAEYSFYSNAPEAVYILTNIEAVWSPAKTLYNSHELINSNADLKSPWQGKGKSCLVWFNNIDRKFLFTVEELQKIANMVIVANLKDGEIYTVRKK